MIDRTLARTYAIIVAFGSAFAFSVVPIDRPFILVSVAIALLGVFLLRKRDSRLLFAVMYIFTMAFGFFLSSRFYFNGSLNSQGMSLVFIWSLLFLVAVVHLHVTERAA